MSDRLNATTKTRQSSDSTFKVNPFQSRGFVLQTKSEESTPATKAQLWENYQQAKHLNQNSAKLPPIQAKLSIGQPGDKYEQEADSVADRVMSMSEPMQVQREAMSEEEELQMKPLAGTISPLVQREAMPEEELQKRNNQSIEKIIMPYRNPKATHFNADREGDLKEDSFNLKSPREKKTKPWIKEILIDFAMAKNDEEGNLIPVGTATAYYEQNESALPPITIGVTGGSSGEGLGLTCSGAFVVRRIEGVGYNDVPVEDEKDREEDNEKYSKSNNSSMPYAIFFHGGRALHGGSLSKSSHGCVHTVFDSYLKQINYHSVKDSTRVTVKFASGLEKDIKSGQSSNPVKTQLIEDYAVMLKFGNYQEAVDLLLTFSEYNRKIILETSSLQDKINIYQSAIKNTNMDKFDALGNETRSAYLHAKYEEALEDGKWEVAAEFLNGLSRGDIKLSLIRLEARDRALLHDGAVKNPKVGEAAQVAQMTKSERKKK